MRTSKDLEKRDWVKRHVNSRPQHGTYECEPKMEGSVNGFPVMKIRERLLEEGIEVSRKSIYILKDYNQTSSAADQKGAPRQRLLGNEHFKFMDEAIEVNTEFM